MLKILIIFKVFFYIYSTTSIIDHFLADTQLTTGDFVDVHTLTTETKGKEKPKEVEEHQTITQGNELFHSGSCSANI